MKQLKNLIFGYKNVLLVRSLPLPPALAWLAWEDSGFSTLFIAEVDGISGLIWVSGMVKGVITTESSPNPCFEAILEGKD